MFSTPVLLALASLCKMNVKFCSSDLLDFIFFFYLFAAEQITQNKIMSRE